MAKMVGMLFFAVMLTAFGLNIIVGDQYVALVLPKGFKVQCIPAEVSTDSVPKV